MDPVKTINQILGIKESYQAPSRLMDILYDRERREDVFMQFLEAFNYDVSYDWFHEYFQNEHADRKEKKQDFTPNSVSDVLNRLVGSKPDSRTYDVAAGTGGITIRKWEFDRMQHSPFDYRPSLYFYWCEELSERAFPFLLFNLLIRGMNAVAIRCDVLSRQSEGAFFIQNDKDDHLGFSSLNLLPYNEFVERELKVHFTSHRYKPIKETLSWPKHLVSEPMNAKETEQLSLF